MAAKRTAGRTSCNPWDMCFPLCVGRMCDGTMFSSVCALPSPASAEGCCPSLFGWFTGTTAQSDFSCTFMSAVRFTAFADRSWSVDQDVQEISRFSCMLFLSACGVICPSASRTIISKFLSRRYRTDRYGHPNIETSDRTPLEKNMALIKLKLGNSGLEIAPIVFGGNVFGWTADEATSFRLLDAFVAAGFNAVDTADVYSRWVPGNKGGESETIIGKWLKRGAKRQQVIIATKVASEMGPGKKGLSKRYILAAVEDSLQRLQTDYIDLYQSHVDDADAPLEETLETYAQLIQQGKVRAIGASNYNGKRLGEALQISRKKGLPRYESLQPLYNLYDRAEFEADLAPLCLRENIGVIPYFSLASGFLAGKYRSEADLAKSARGSLVKKYLNERGYKILSALDQVAKTHSSTQSQVAIAWLLAQPSVTAPIASATNLNQLQALLSAADLKLDPASIEKLNQASAYAAGVASSH